MEPIKQQTDEGAHLNASDLMQKKMIEAVFKSYDFYCNEDENAEYKHSTKFFRSVQIIYAILYRYMPNEMRIAIKQAFDEIEQNNKKIDEDKNTNDANKKLNKCRKEDETGGQILQLCILALQYSPVNTELKEIIMTSDKINFKEIISKIRSDKPIGLFKEGEI